MELFKSQWLQESPRHVPGPYRRHARYGRRRRRHADAAGADVLDVLDATARCARIRAEREILRLMAGHDIAA